MSKVYIHWTTINDGPESRTFLRLSTVLERQSTFEPAVPSTIGITMEQASRLWPELKAFAETGRPPIPPEATEGP